MIKRRKVSDQVRVVYTGNIGLAQDVFLLLDVAEALQKEQDICFQVVGYGYHKQTFEKLVKERGLTNIEFLDAMPRWDALKQLAKSDIAFATLVESTAFDTVTPGKIIDYMAMGCAIVGAVSGHACACHRRSRSLVTSPFSVKKRKSSIISSSYLEIRKNVRRWDEPEWLMFKNILTGNKMNSVSLRRSNKHDHKWRWRNEANRHVRLEYVYERCAGITRMYGTRRSRTSC
ncbi:glycosyltransferase [Exiguobacterium sp. SL14]|nr:glycosyltransferase [Exiguobacterium sp. SL14]MCY1691962.1 glycosyltransferase [Exiguobacterium sp. SL14]